ncbi:Crp/Fnr family transcriptional regulator [Psychrilyobacter atlanticus]|uniref:Crp/Fnr family transcriptional regulator n=1 Tax=Psychrilyobacter atlanticus TaxID=271091 RepID=UPI00041B9166|nr:Crp/Fnr family transcriptional regulator [Psychrilyobacter atlanticus]
MKDKEKFPFYNLLTVEERKNFKVKIYKKNEIITLIEEEEKFYFILEGEARFFKNLEKIRLASASILSEGYIIGIMKFLNGVGAGDAVVTTNTLKAIKLDVNMVKRLLEESVKFSNYILNITSKRWVETVEVMTIRSFSGNKGIIAYYLIKKSKEGYIYIENYNEVIKGLNISGNGFYSTINKFLKDGIIEKSKNSIKILNYERLKEFYIDYLH